MSYSIPFVPLGLLRTPNMSEQLKKLQYEISLSKSLLNNMKIQMVENVSKIETLEANPSVRDSQKKSLQQIKKIIPQSFYSKAITHLGTSGPTPDKPQDASLITDSEIIGLHKSVKALREEVSRLKMKQILLGREAILIEDMMDSGYLFDQKVGPNGKKITLFNDPLRSIEMRFRMRVWPCLSKGLGIFTAVLSVALINIEVLGLFNKQIDDYLRSIISRRDNWIIATISLLIFGYAIFCVHYAVFRFKFAGFYNLYYGKQTDTASLLYSGL